jgi:hypothetical protein
MTLCGKGYVEQTKADREKTEVELDTIVFAASNDPDAITPDSLNDRFMAWEFEQYSLDEFRDVSSEILPRDYGVSQELASYIAERVYDEMDSTRPRDVKRIAELADTRADVDELVEAIG